MEPNWTDEQSQAILTEQSNLLVAAGAGAGKTAVLVERIIRKITDSDLDIDIDRLLVVTYTNAAAAEMKERIGDSLQKLLEENFQSRRLQRQLTLLNQSNIMTMHSFCLKVIKENFHVIDLDPNFRVSDNEEGILLKRDAVLELFEEKYDGNDTDFLNLVDSYGDKNDVRVQDIVISLYEFVQSFPCPEKWLHDSGEKFNLPDEFNFSDSIWAEVIISDSKLEIKSLRDRLKRQEDIICRTSGLEAYIPVFHDDVSQLDHIMELQDWNYFSVAISDIKFPKLPSLKGQDYDKSVKEAAVKALNDVKKKLKYMWEKIFSYGNTAGESIKNMYPVMKCLTDLVVDFDRKYSSKKRERNILDFSDIEHFCLNILSDSSIALHYRKNFQEILIDEYQDINEVQEAIVNMIGGQDNSPNLFMVGDVKQSIYRFRQAKPELFLEKYSSYSDKKGTRNRKIKLFKNFRSRRGIIDGVNYLFTQIMCKKIGELDYGKEEELEVGSDYPETSDFTFYGDSIEINLVDKVKGENNIETEARLIARRINDLINPENNVCFKVYDKNIKTYRDLMYKDIVVLMRTTKNWAPVIMKELNNSNIPVFADISTGYFETIEVRTIMSLLQIIDNPIQDIPLISVLRSPIASFSPEDLIDIRIINKSLPFYDVLSSAGSEQSAEHISQHLKEKICSFLNRLQMWREKIVHMPIDEFLWYVYGDTGYYGFVGAMSGGTQRQANLRMLFEKAQQYEKSSYKGLFNFINFINKLRISSGDMGSANILDENEDVVRIMSIHKSKGLEFPVVILAGSGKNFNLMDANNSIIFDEKIGIGPEYVDLKKRIRHPTVIKQILRNKIKTETLSEEVRILYVAFTRAKEKLIITGMVNDVGASAKKWCDESLVEEDKVPDYALMNAKNYLDWIGEALVRHRDGGVIREISGENSNEISVAKDDSKWSVKIWKAEDFQKDSMEKNNDDDIVKRIKDKSMDSSRSRYYDEINRRLSWNYKYREASIIPAKFSVSELKRRFAMIDMNDSAELLEDVNLKKPNFIRENSGLSAAERGTLLHLVMQHIDIGDVDSKASIDKQIDKMVFREFIARDERKAVSSYKILKFFQSGLGIRMKKSEKVYREVPFYIQEDSTSIYKKLPKGLYKDEKVLIQGIIDCYFKEQDGIVLVDYKTDYVEKLEELRDKYKIQIYYYAKALEKITGASVKQRYLYSFYKDTAIEI